MKFSMQDLLQWLTHLDRSRSEVKGFNYFVYNVVIDETNIVTLNNITSRSPEISLKRHTKRLYAGEIAAMLELEQQPEILIGG